MTLESALPHPLWWDAVRSEPTRPPLPADASMDVVIVGAGFTGLWTAYYLKALDPALRIMVLEREHVGFGASGRNGGWCQGEYPLGLATLAHHHGAEAAMRFQRAAFDAVLEVGRVAQSEDFDCHYQLGGRALFARSPLQAERAKQHVSNHHAVGLSHDDIRYLDRDEAVAIARVSGVTGGSFTPTAAALQPALLAHGLADAAERRGVVIHEGTAVTAIEAGRVHTRAQAHPSDGGAVVTAGVVLRATEGYTRDFAPERRTLIPLYSLMVATEPIPERTWDELGLAGREVFADYGHMVIYGQRTADGRLAFGGRGAPYHWRSGIAARFDVDDTVHGHLARLLPELFPTLEGTAITHRWGGPLGVPRDWSPTVSFDPASGLGFAGGYVGDGVALANLAGRTLAELVVGTESERTILPWVQHPWRKWEPEPLRYLGVNAGLWLTRSADREEARTGKPSPRARLGDFIRGKRD